MWNYFERYVFANPMWFVVIGFILSFAVIGYASDAPPVVFWFLGLVIVVFLIGTYTNVRKMKKREEK